MTLPELIKEAKKDFNDFYWETGKYSKRSTGIKVYEDFLDSLILKVANQTKEEMMVGMEEKEIKHPVLYIREEGWNSARKQMLANWEEFIRK